MLTPSEQVGVSSAATRPMSIRAYARRRGTSAPSVLRAIKQQRLSKSLVFVGGKAQIGDPDLADQEWAQNTDLGRAPTYIKVRAAVTAGAVTPVTAVSPAPAMNGTTLTEAAASEKFWRARLAEQEFLERTGQLIQVKDHEARLNDAQSRWAGLLALVRTKLLAVPSMVKGDCNELTLRHVAAIDARIRAALEAIADGEGLQP